MHSARSIAVALCAGVWLSGCGERASLESSAEDRWAMLDKYCVDCHNRIDLTAELAFDSMSPATIAADAEIWERVVRQLRSRTMPPPGGPRPQAHEVDGFVAWMEANLDEAVDERPGHIALHRLNRTQYANAIRDLLALEVDPETLLPVEDVADGFDVMASALQVSPSFIEQYIDAARVLSARAVGNPAPRPIGVPYTFSDERAQ